MAKSKEKPGIEESDCYHGLLPREDVEVLLKSPGDFLVRFTQPSLGEPSQYVISVCTSDEKEEKKEDTCKYIIKHLVLDFANNKYTFDQRLFFNDIPELIDKYVKEKTPFTVGTNAKKKEYLKNGIKRPAWELQHDWIQLGDEIGSGQFGVIRKAELAIPGRKAKPVAVKVAKTTDVNPEVKLKIKEMMQEARVMRNFQHPNVVLLHGVAVAQEPLMIVMEFVSHGDLKKILEKEKLNNEIKMNIMMQAATGIAYLHAKKVIHRDIAARNCLVGGEVPEKMEVKISDFGLSRPGSAYRIQHDRPLPVRWLPPEVLISHEFDQRSDVWSFSMMAMEIYSDGLEPYNYLNKDQAKDEIRNFRGPREITDMPAKVYSIFTKYIWVDVKQRATMAQIISEFTQPPPNKKPAASPGRPPSAPSDVIVGTERRKKKVIAASARKRSDAVKKKGK